MSLTFGEKIKEARKQKKLTQRQLADLIGAAHNSISDWENNKNKPDPDTIELLCGALKITPNYLLASSEEEFSPKEKLFIKIYRSLDDAGKERIDYELKKECDRVKEIEELKSKLNTEFSSEIIPMRVISYYQRMASSGSGEYLFDDVPTDLIEVEDTPISRNADFVLGVNGDSMYPTYKDGEKVFVKKASEIQTGKIGVFTIGNDCYIKELGTDRLISHNENKEHYPDITSVDRAKLVGEVIGKVGEDITAPAII